MSSQIYYVRNAEGVAISANASFKVEEFTGNPIGVNDVTALFPNIINLRTHFLNFKRINFVSKIFSILAINSNFKFIKS